MDRYVKCFYFQTLSRFPPYRYFMLNDIPRPPPSELKPNPEGRRKKKTPQKRRENSTFVPWLCQFCKNLIHTVSKDISYPSTLRRPDVISIQQSNSYTITLQTKVKLGELSVKRPTTLSRAHGCDLFEHHEYLSFGISSDGYSATVRRGSQK